MKLVANTVITAGNHLVSIGRETHFVAIFSPFTNKFVEQKRAKKEIGSSLEAEIEIGLNEKLFEISKNIDFSELCITSKSIVKKIDGDEILVKSKKADGKKCSICWKISSEKCKRPSCSI